MAFPYSAHKTYVTGEVLTATDLNATDVNHINNNIPESIDDLSDGTTEARSTRDPDLDASGSLATTAGEEIQGLRHVLVGITGETYWYNAPSNTLASINTKLITLFNYRRPVLQFSNITDVVVENNTGTADQTEILFPDGEQRSVTESSPTTYRRFDITSTAEFTSGSELSGLRSGLSEASDTWYAIYAVKSQINSSNFVLAGDTTFPIQSNFSTLNTRYGTDSWVYLGCIANGNNDGTTTSDIIQFKMVGCKTIFMGTNTVGNVANPVHGIQLDRVNSTALAWTYVAGSNLGSAELPDTICSIRLVAASTQVGTGFFTIKDRNAVYTIARLDSPDDNFYEFEIDPTQGIELSNSGASTENMMLNMIAFEDKALAGAICPQL